jgi:hypothetical protein
MIPAAGSYAAIYFLYKAKNSFHESLGWNKDEQKENFENILTAIKALIILITNKMINDLTYYFSKNYENYYNKIQMHTYIACKSSIL